VSARPASRDRHLVTATDLSRQGAGGGTPSGSAGGGANRVAPLRGVAADKGRGLG